MLPKQIRPIVEHRVQRLEIVARDAQAVDWDRIAPLAPFVLADGSAPALQQTRVRLCHDDRALHTRFDCDDRDIRASLVGRDEPLYIEEVVELFLAPGETDPQVYYEFEVNPLGALFDAEVYSPTGCRDQMTVRTAWDCPELRWGAERADADSRWSAWLSVPWSAVGGFGGSRPEIWRANFYRIERPANSAPEFSAWSPTLTEPADFHKPARFGLLRL